MSGFGIFSIGLLAIALLIGMGMLGMVLARLYKKATKEISYVRTGFGGQKVIMNGGALVFPILHDTIAVNMNTLRLAVSRKDTQALITHDRMRVDVVAEFYVRTQPTAESIANAAQTLGERTTHPETLKELVEGKFVDALRSVAAEMTMEELHEKRTDFVHKVQQAVSEDLLKNGLELETVSLTSLDQTDKSFFNPNNAFDAEGLTHLTEEIEARRKKRNDIEQDTNVQIAGKIMESEKKRLEIGREEEYARLEQQREIEIRRAEQSSQIVREQAEKDREAKQAEIVAKREVEISEQAKAIAIAEKSREQSEAAARADTARALAVAAEEKVMTAKEKEVAERNKEIELIRAKQEAERESISIRVAAEAEKAAAQDQASAIRELAQAESDKLKITADGEAEAEKTRAHAAEVRYTIDAEGKRALNEAANILSSDQISLQMKLALIENLENIIRESVRPMENIDGIKIVQVGGLGGEKGASPEGGKGSLADQVVNSALQYRAQAPLLDSLLKEVGITGGDINRLTEPLKEVTE